MENLGGRKGTAQEATPAESSLEIITHGELQPVRFDWIRNSKAHVLIADLPAFKKEDLKVEVDNLGKLIISGERRIGEGKYSRFKQVIEVPSDSIIEKIQGKFESDRLSVIMPLREIGKKEEKQPAPKKEPSKDDAVIVKYGAQEGEKATQKQEPKKENAAIGKDSSKKEDIKPTQKQEAKKEDASTRKKSTEKEEWPANKEKEKEQEEEKRKREAEGEEEEDDERRLLFERVVELINKNKALIAAAALGCFFGVYLTHQLQ